MPVQFSQCSSFCCAFRHLLMFSCTYRACFHFSDIISLHIPLMYGGVSLEVNFGQLPIQSLFLLLFTFVDTSIQYVQFNTHSVSHDLSFMDQFICVWPDITRQKISFQVSPFLHALTSLSIPSRNPLISFADLQSQMEKYWISI